MDHLTTMEMVEQKFGNDERFNAVTAKERAKVLQKRLEPEKRALEESMLRSLLILP